MSIRLMSLVLEITWPTQSQLLVALKLADHANDDGSNVYPAKASIARLAQCSESTVQNALRAFRDCGFVSVVRQGGNGPKDPTVYAINVHLLTHLANAKSILTGGADRIVIPEDVAAKSDENKGSTVDPLDELRGQSEGAKGSTDPAKGSKALTPNHHLEPSREPSLARSANFVLGSEVPPRLVLRTDPNWRLWLDWVFEKWGASTSDAFAKEGSMVVFSAVPSATAKQPKLPPTDPDKFDALRKARTITDRSKAMTGDAA